MAGDGQENHRLGQHLSRMGGRLSLDHIIPRGQRARGVKGQHHEQLMADLAEFLGSRMLVTQRHQGVLGERMLHDAYLFGDRRVADWRIDCGRADDWRGLHGESGHGRGYGFDRRFDRNHWAGRWVGASEADHSGGAGVHGKGNELVG